jgi:hypothetical protein
MTFDRAFPLKLFICFKSFPLRTSASLCARPADGARNPLGRAFARRFEMRVLFRGQDTRGHVIGVSNFSLFEPQTFRDEDAVQSVEEELHQQCEQGSGNCALQNRAGVV